MKIFFTAVATLFIFGCSHQQVETTNPAREPNQVRAVLPDHAEYRRFYQIAEGLDFTQPNTKLKMSSGGTSVYAVIEVDGRAIGAVLPENSATKVSGEIAAFHVARALGVGHLYQPGVYYHLTGRNLAAFKAIIPKDPFPSKWKEFNRVNVSKLIDENPDGIGTVFKEFGKKPDNYDDLVDRSANAFRPEHRLPGSQTSMGQLLSCRGAQPNKNTVVTVNKGQSTEYMMAKQLSSIFLIDGIMQQWDRFSGGNLQTITENGQVRFAANDNGGTWSKNWTSRFLSIVSRFDRAVAQRILELDAFLNQGSGEFLGIRTEAELAQAFGIERFPAAMRNIKSSIRLVATHIQSHPNCFFEE